MNESSGMYGVPKPWYFLFVRADERQNQDIVGGVQESSGIIYLDLNQEMIL